MDDSIKQEIINLRKLGFKIAEISSTVGFSVTEVCNVIYAQNEQDKKTDD